MMDEAALLAELASLVDGEPDLVANLANITAALRDAAPRASWIGFYIRRGDELVLGPFQGKVACVRIAMGKGVCGTAAAERRTIVVPIVRAGEVVAVLDLDSYELAAFDERDAAWLGRVAELAATLRW